ncbi:nitric oxide reductase activation protein NorD [Enterovibrio norvegicus]|uniref:nitric oxide reductase activation protein NorD n=1 Tax=Enterovibrio norvegicus TaxID=188144 RepID=UPI001F534532|nr:VWA domain-containing protein [Enterovibrio norvegicus]
MEKKTKTTIHVEQRDGNVQEASTQLLDIGHASEMLALAPSLLSKDAFQTHVDLAHQLNQKRVHSDVVLAWLETLPLLVTQYDERILPRCFECVVALSSCLSGARLVHFLRTLSAISERSEKDDIAFCGTNDVTADTMYHYISLVESLSRISPKCIKPLLDCSASTLSLLSVSGFEQWAHWGATHYSNDDRKLQEFFGLVTAESQSLFQRQRTGTQFIDIQRHLHFFLRAVWASDFTVRPISSLSGDGFQHPSPTLQERRIFLPDVMRASVTKTNGVLSGTHLYRAAAAHCAAHLYYSEPINNDAFSVCEKHCIALIEDARIEALAIRHFGGLKRLWAPFYANDDRHCQHDMLSTLRSALFEQHYAGSSVVISACVERFNDLLNGTQAHAMQCVSDVGCWLAKQIATHQMMETVDDPSSWPIYRDDNQWLWNHHDANDLPSLQLPQVTRTVSVMEMVNEIDCELANDDAQEIWVLASAFYRDGDPEDISLNMLEGREQVSPPFYYAEWDYVSGSHLADWTTLTERWVAKGDPSRIDQVINKNQAHSRRLSFIVEALQPKAFTRQRRQYEGDELDLDAAIDAMKDIKRGHLPELNVNQRLTRHTRDLAVLVLLDLSQSTLSRVSQSTNASADGGSRVLDVAREATVMLSMAIEQIGDPYAVHGFQSNGRHDVQYLRFKGFDESLNDDVKARFDGMSGGLSTRMGAALRHAQHYLALQPQQNRLVLVISDGEPADIDVLDPVYLYEDTRHAVLELKQASITPFCLTIDPHADRYVEGIFGQGHYAVLDDANRLPEVLPSLFASLTRQA